MPAACTPLAGAIVYSVFQYYVLILYDYNLLQSLQVTVEIPELNPITGFLS